jgi:zinc/manganese transport system permease protein
MTVELLQSDIFRNAVIAGTIAAAVGSLVGYFVVLRAQAFAAESLLDVCFAGATGAALLAVSPVIGMAVAGLGAALGIGALGERARERSVEIGMVVSFALGLGVLFLGMYARGSASHSNAGTAILFGSMLSIREVDLLRIGGLGLAAAAGLLVLYRPLLFSTIDPEASRARGVPVRRVSSAFLVVVAPAASAARLSRRPGRAVLLAIALGTAVTWGGILIAFLWRWPHLPVGFTVSALAALLYFATTAGGRTSYAGRGKTVIMGDTAETVSWTSRRGSRKPSESSANARLGRGG